MQKQIKRVLVAAVFASLFGNGLSTALAAEVDAVAIVNGNAISKQALQRQLGVTHLKRVAVEERTRIALNSLLSDEVLLQNSAGKGLEQDPLIQGKLADVQFPILVAAMRKELRNDSKTDEQVEDYYVAHPEEFPRLRVSHILLNNLKQAQDLHQQIKDGAEFATLAKEFSLDGATQSRGGEVGYLAPGAAAQPFEQQAFAL